MRSHSRELVLLVMTSSALFLTQCSELTKVDWSLIPPAAGAPSGGALGMAGEAGVPEVPSSDAGAAGASGEAGMGGAGGSSGEEETGDTGGGGVGGGSAGRGGTGGAFAGSGGSLGGIGGGAGMGAAGNGGSAGGAVLHPTCDTPPTTAVVDPQTLLTKIVLFDGGPGLTGDRSEGTGSGRTGLDAACTRAKTALNLPHSRSHAVVSVSPTDQLVDMAALYQLPATGKEVVSTRGIHFADAWDDILFGGATSSLVCTGVMPAGVQTWLTGTSTERKPDPTQPLLFRYGQYDLTPDGNNTCTGWTLGTFSNVVGARVGSAIAERDPLWFFTRFVGTCDGATHHVLCVAYEP